MLYPVNPRGELMAISADKGPAEVKRWTAARKMEVVLRHMRGESLDSLSREIGVPASQIEEWHQAAVRGIEESLKSRGTEPLQAELDLAKKRIGELSMENELLRERSRRNGVFLGGRLK
jgi:transposase